MAAERQCQAKATSDMKLYWGYSLTWLITSVYVWRVPNKSKNISPANSLFELSFGGKISSPWLWSSSSPPPVTSLTITLSELFLLLCGKMAGRKCVYTVILLSVCAVWPRPEISFGMLSSFFFSKQFIFLSTNPHPHLSLSAPLHPTNLPPSMTRFRHQWQKRQTGSL